MFFPGRDNPSLNMTNASFTEEDILWGKSLCISTGKHVLQGGWCNPLFCGALGYFQGIWGLWGLLLEPNQHCHRGQPGRRGWSCSPQLDMEFLATELGTPHKGFSVQGPFLAKKFGARLEKS